MEEAERQQEEKEQKTHNIRCDKIDGEKSTTYGHKRTRNENYLRNLQAATTSFIEPVRHFQKSPLTLQFNKTTLPYCAVLLLKVVLQQMRGVLQRGFRNGSI